MTLVVTQSLVNWSNTVGNNTTHFREFVTRMTDVFSLAGWVNTNASGSIDPATVNAVGNGTIAGYQVWRFNDTLHNNGYPVFIKVEYGSAAATSVSINYQAGLWFSAGFRHDGTASISVTGVNGVGSTPRGTGVLIQGDQTNRRTIRFCCISGSDAAGVIGEENNNGAVAFSVERTKDANGNSTNEGVVVSYFNNNWIENFRSSHMLYSYNTASFTPVEETSPNYILSNGHAMYNTDVTLGMLIPVISSSYGYPSRMLGLVNGASFVQNTTHIMTLFGTSSTYWISSNGAPNETGAAAGGVRGGRRDASGNFRWIMRYE